MIALALIAWSLPHQGKAQEENQNQEPIVFYKIEGPGINEPYTIPPKPKPAPPKPKPKPATPRTPSAVPGEWGGSCVPWAKWYLGVGGTWGYGGRNLSANSPVAVGAVILFGNTHVGVVEDFTSTQVLVRHSNGDYKGTVRLQWFDLNDRSIRGYHLF